MRLLLDTHALLWWLDGDRRLSWRTLRLVSDDDGFDTFDVRRFW